MNLEIPPVTGAKYSYFESTTCGVCILGYWTAPYSEWCHKSTRHSVNCDATQTESSDPFALMPVNWISFECDSQIFCGPVCVYIGCHLSSFIQERLTNEKPDYCHGCLVSLGEACLCSFAVIVWRNPFPICYVKLIISAELFSAPLMHIIARISVCCTILLWSVLNFIIKPFFSLLRQKPCPNRWIHFRCPATLRVQVTLTLLRLLFVWYFTCWTSWMVCVCPCWSIGTEVSFPHVANLLCFSSFKKQNQI